MSEYLDLVNSSGSHRASKVKMPVVEESASAYDAILPFVLRIVIPNASTNITLAAPCALRIVDAWAIAKANGAAGDLVQVFNGGTAVTDAMDLSGADQAVVRAGTINDASYEFTAGATITVDPTSATDCSCDLYISCLPV